MYTVDSYTVQLMHQERLREAERRWKLHLLRDATEQSPVIVEAGLIHDIKQWFGSRSRNRRQEVRDVRRATAV